MEAIGSRLSDDFSKFVEFCSAQVSSIRFSETDPAHTEQGSPTTHGKRKNPRARSARGLWTVFIQFVRPPSAACDGR